jgi:fatty acid desaturase
MRYSARITTDVASASRAPSSFTSRDRASSAPVRLPDSVEWPTVVVAVVIWTGLIVVVLTHRLVPWWVTVPTLAVLSGWYASLQHEVAHGHPTPWPAANLVIAGAPLGMVYPYERFRDLHLAHHLDPALLTEPGVDNESRYCSPEAWERAGAVERLVLRAERTLAGHLTIGVVRGAVGYIAGDLRRALHDRRIRLVWARHAVAVTVIVAVLASVGFPFVQFAVGAIYGRLFFTGLRVFAEHRAVPDGTRTAVIRAGLPMRLIYLNNNLHHTHHARAGVAWYHLPRLHDELGSDELARAGAGLYEGGYLELARRYALRPFCQPVHPVPAEY